MASPLLVNGGLATEPCPRAAAGEPACTAEVRKLQAQIARNALARCRPASLERLSETHEDVARLHVTVDQASRVHMPQSGQELHGDAAPRAVRQLLVWAKTCAATQDVAEVAVGLQEREDSCPTLPVRLIDLQQSHDVGVTHGLQGFDLALRIAVGLPVLQSVQLSLQRPLVHNAAVHFTVGSAFPHAVDTPVHPDERVVSAAVTNGRFRRILAAPRCG